MASGIWSVEEDNKLIELKRRGIPRREISLILRRSANAVTSRWKRYRPRFPKKRMTSPVIYICRGEVPDYYGLGWIPTGQIAGDDTIAFVWPNKRPPEWPSNYWRAA